METKLFTLSRTPAQALGGYPVVVDGEVLMKPPSEFLPDNKERTLYILDELTSTADDTLAATMELLMARKLGGKCYPNIYPIGTLNPPEVAANGTALPEPLLNRCAVYHATDKDWLQWALGQAEQTLLKTIFDCAKLNIPLLIEGMPGIGKTAVAMSIKKLPNAMKLCDDRKALKDSGILEYLSKNHKQMTETPEPGATNAFATPRSWTTCAHAVVNNMAHLGPLIVGERSWSCFAEARVPVNLNRETVTEAERIQIIQQEWREFVGTPEEIRDYLSTYEDIDWIAEEPSRLIAIVQEGLEAGE